MKVFNLSCENEHSFEGWFASAEDFDRQQESKLVECPVWAAMPCKLLSAPHINRGALAPQAQAIAMSNSDDAKLRAMARIGPTVRMSVSA
jgi:hypothetical protein